MMKELDLSQQSGGCGSNSTSVRLMRFWLESGGNQTVKIIAQQGVQADEVEMWATVMQERGVKVLKKELVDGKVVYEVYLP
ncbi:MAG: hypothetical protein TQ35_0006500 [Candidatus Aramenus sulfurataquae]|jgi:hypothetical protein|uniref:Uncharacterized protein n=3 Tax=Candidatus Aramenus sulfurataquae TaxID=1326980 RepID=A0AAE3K1C1_9CREN|nr:hypothetical protein [Candidatus Aramenus sulfurataquae]